VLNCEYRSEDCEKRCYWSLEKKAEKKERRRKKERRKTERTKSLLR